MQKWCVVCCCSGLRDEHAPESCCGANQRRALLYRLAGWFTDPSPFFDGPLDEQEAMDALKTALEPLLEALGDLPPVLGTLSLRFKVSGSDGSVSDVEFLADTLVVLPQGWTGQGYGEEGLSAAGVRAAVQHTAKEHMLDASFPTCKEGDTLITLPLVFE